MQGINDMTGNEIQLLQAGLKAAKEQVELAIAGITEAEARQQPAPDAWSVSQLLAHIAEIIGFWMDKAVLITEEKDPQISRSDVENDLRLAAVTDAAEESLEDLLQSVDIACEEGVETIGEIDPADLDRPGHRETNPITAGGVIENLAKHVSAHAVQITEARQQMARKS